MTATTSWFNYTVDSGEFPEPGDWVMTPWPQLDAHQINTVFEVAPVPEHPQQTDEEDAATAYLATPLVGKAEGYLKGCACAGGCRCGCSCAGREGCGKGQGIGWAAATAESDG